ATKVAAKEPAPPPAEAQPWHDPALPIDDRLKLADSRPVADRLMAAMAQLDCGACGYDCRKYSQAIADGSETRLTLCSPGGSETAKALKRLLKEQPHPTNGTSHNGNGKSVNGSNGVSVASAVLTATNGTKTKASVKRWTREHPYTARLLRSVNLNG